MQINDQQSDIKPNAHYNGILEKNSEKEKERKEGEKEERKNGCNVLPKMARVSPQNDIM